MSDCDLCGLLRQHKTLFEDSSRFPSSTHNFEILQFQGAPALAIAVENFNSITETLLQRKIVLMCLKNIFRRASRSPKAFLSNYPSRRIVQWGGIIASKPRVTSIIIFASHPLIPFVTRTIDILSLCWAIAKIKIVDLRFLRFSVHPVPFKDSYNLYNNANNFKNYTRASFSRPPPKALPMDTTRGLNMDP